VNPMRNKNKARMSHMRFVTPKLRWLSLEGFSQSEAMLFWTGAAMRASPFPARLCIRHERKFSHSGVPSTRNNLNLESEFGLEFRDKISSRRCLLPRYFIRLLQGNNSCFQGAILGVITRVNISTNNFSRFGLDRA
jgi:hypothetical protein